MVFELSHEHRSAEWNFYEWDSWRPNGRGETLLDRFNLALGNKSYGAMALCVPHHQVFTV